MKKIFLLINVLGMIFGLLLLTSCTQGPTENQILKDYVSRASESNSCKRCVCFTDVKVLRKLIEGKDAKIVVQVTGDWIDSGFDPGFLTGPCDGFYKNRGSNQTAEKTLFYKKYNTGWHLEFVMD